MFNKWWIILIVIQKVLNKEQKDKGVGIKIYRDQMRNIISIK